MSTPCCFGSNPNHENGGEKQKNCADDLNYQITFDNEFNWDPWDWDSCISENIKKTPKTQVKVNLSIELDRILNVDQSRNVSEIFLLSNFKVKIDYFSFALRK